MVGVCPHTRFVWQDWHYLSLATFCQCSSLWPGLVFVVVVVLADRVGTASSFSRTLYFEPKLNAQQCAICEAFLFRNASRIADRGVWGLQLLCGCIPSTHCLPLSFFGFIFHRKRMKRKLGVFCQLFTATNCSTLTRHASLSIPRY